MAKELAVRGVRFEGCPAPARKGVLVRRGAFGVRREVFAVGKMSVPARRLLRERLESELGAVRDALRKAEVLSSYGAGATGAAAPAARKDGPLVAAKAPVGEDGGGRAAKRRKVAFFVEQGTGRPKRMRQDGSRERLAGRLASLAAALPDHVVAFLLNQSVGDGDSCGDGGGIKDEYVQSMKGGALFQLKMLLNKFAPESTPENRGAPVVASGGSCLPRHQGAGGKTATVQEEEEVGVNICGGVSRIAIRDIAEEYGELVEDIGVELLSPLQRKYVDLAEQGEYVDICGDASPVVFPTKADDTSSSPSLSSSSDSDASSSDSDSSSSSSDSDSKSDPDKTVVPKEKYTSAQQPQVPAPEAVHAAEPDDVQDKRAPPVPTVLQITRSPPAPAVLLPKVNDTYAPPSEPAPETVQIPQQGELQDQCAPPAPTGHPVTSITPRPAAAVPKVNDDTYEQPPEPAPEAVRIAEPEELQDQRVAPAATGLPITGSAPPPAVLPEENGASSQPPELAPVAVAARIAEPEEVHGEGAAPAPAPAATNDLSDLVTMAKDEAERRRQLAKERAKAKARQMLLEVEKAAPPDERVHPRDMELLGIAAFEYVASTVQGARTAAPPRVNGGGGGLRVSPGGPSVLQQLGYFLKADDGSEEEEQQLLQLASHGDDMEVEDGEIR